MENPKVSVCVTTYNHAKFIRQCLDGILNQQTDFPFEIILGEDESTDGTREICKEYAQHFPDKIKLILRSRKDVIYIKGKATGRYNFTETVKAANGKYIALCEGDDYWTNPSKLQEQVDFLEQHPEFSLCFTDVNVVDKDGKEIKPSYVDYTKDVFTHEEFVTKINAPTLSVIFRKDALPKDFPSSYYKVFNADTFLYCIISEKGPVKFINEKTGSYRVHGGGIYQGEISSRNLENVLNTYSAMLHYFKSKEVKRNIRDAMNTRYANFLISYLSQKKFGSFIKIFFASLKFYILHFQLPPVGFMLKRINKRLTPGPSPKERGEAPSA